ncbi:hypothetical protein FC75_GL002429 [Lacticaseibacillus camelliae DSM 22697 = JCM 13995]|uniref:Gram-positive cocci surface proteins LPxTG domain-containing protein n=3 Tax=Lacticaseibacillus camelliae TaxID=381742 RepID=A0A0R2EXD7_9LACO|nr:hypothetical protein FC75_GL002429 [Lacticaseibacillus camelliae DSM 22697 = JCM 13995]
MAYKVDPEWDGKQFSSDMLSSMQSIEALDPDDPVKDLKGLELLPKLYNLSLGAGSEVSDFSLLPKLTYLKMLDLEGINLEHIGPKDLQSDSITKLTIGDDYSTHATTTLQSLELDGSLPSLQQLTVEDSSTITKVSVKNLPVLEELRAEDLTSLDDATVENLPALSNLDLYNDPKLATLNASGLDKVNDLTISKDAFSEFDLKSFPGLIDFDASDNQLSSLDLSNVNLTSLNLANNQFKSIDLSKQTHLGTLYLQGNQLSEIDLAGLEYLSTVDLSYNQLTTFDAPDAHGDDVSFDELRNEGEYKAGLRTLSLNGNKLTTFDASLFPQVTQLDLSDNQLTSFTPNHVVASLNLTNNNLTGTLNISGASHLINLAASGNAFSYIANDVPDISVISQYVWNYVADEHVRANTYEVDGHWYVNVRDLIGDADASDEDAKNDLAYVHVDTSKWQMRDDGTAIYIGEGRPTSFEYDGMVSHMEWTTASAVQFQADYHVTAALTPGADSDIKVAFKSANNDEGTVSGTVTAKAGQLLNENRLPTPEPQAGYRFDHWQDQDNNVIDFDLYKPIGNTTLYAVFAKDDGKTSASVKLVFKSADEKRGTVDKTISAKAGTPLNAAKVPTPIAAEGFAFDHWEDAGGNSVDFSNYTPSSDATFTAVFAPLSVDAAAGQKAGVADGAAGKQVADNASQSKAYQDAYTAAYTDAKATYDADFATGEAIGAADSGENLDAADVSAFSAGYQAGYAKGYAETERDSYRGYNTTEAFKVEVKAADATQSDLDTNLSVPQGEIFGNWYEDNSSFRNSGVHEGYTFDHWEDDKGNVIDLTQYKVTRDQIIYAFYTTVDLSGEQGKAAGQADGEAGLPRNVGEDKSVEYINAYYEAYEKGYKIYQQQYDAGVAAGRADGVGNYDYADTTMETEAFQKGYTYGYDEGYAEFTGIASAEDQGAAAGKADGEAGNEPADNSDQSETYQIAYTEAYDATKETADSDFAYGQMVATSDAESTQLRTDISKQSLAFQKGYNETFDELIADYNAGVALAKQDISAGKEPTDVSGHSELFQAGYNQFYEFPADEEVSDEVSEARKRGKEDAQGGYQLHVPDGATAEFEAAYKQAYTFAKAKYDAQYSHGTHDAQLDAGEGLVAMDLTGTSAAYQAGYNQAYNMDFNSIKSDILSAASQATADRDGGKEHADTSHSNVFHQKVYDYFFTSTKGADDFTDDEILELAGFPQANDRHNYTGDMTVTDTGDKGDTGEPADTGDKGDTGEPVGTGDKGDTGDTGEPVDTGDKGDTGEPVDTGDKGDTGEPVDTGDKGDTGEPVDTGDKGDTGEPVDTGDKGDTGEPVDTGDKGDTGEPVDTGDKGDTGEPVDSGDKGDTGEPVDTGDKGDTGEPVGTGDKGDTGEPVDSGDKGEADQPLAEAVSSDTGSVNPDKNGKDAKAASKDNLPQTGEASTQGVLAAGMAVIAAVAGFFGFGKLRKREH